MCRDLGVDDRVTAFDLPVRDASGDYREGVDAWHDAIAAAWVAALPTEAETVALLVWGDPSLYDSTLRIAGRLSPRPKIRVVPGITALQALTAAHGIPLNRINAPVLITTGRQIRDHGWPEGADRVAVLLDGETSFLSLDSEGSHHLVGRLPRDGERDPHARAARGGVRDHRPRPRRGAHRARLDHGYLPSRTRLTFISSQIRKPASPPAQRRGQGAKRRRRSWTRRTGARYMTPCPVPAELPSGLEGMRCGESPNSAAAPATVSGERLPVEPLPRLRGEGGQRATTRKPGDLPGMKRNTPSGRAARRDI